MKSFKWTFVFVAVVGALVAFTVYDNARFEKKEEATEKEKTVLKIPADKINRVEIATRTSKIVLERPEAGAWKVSAPLQDSADQQSVESLLSSLTNEKRLHIVVSGEDLKLQTYGLDDPPTSFKAFGPAGQVDEVKIGAVKAYDSNLYALVNQEKRVLLVSSGWDTYLSKLPKEFRDKHLLRSELKAADVKKVKVAHPGAKADFELVKDGKHWRVAQGGPKFLVVDASVNQFIDRIKGVRGQDFLEGTEAKRAGQALAKPSLQISLITEKPAFNLRFSATEEMKDKKWASSSDLREVLEVTKAIAESVDKTVQDFYDKKLPFAFTAAEPTQIEIDTKDLKGQFDKKQEIWTAKDQSLEKDKVFDPTKLNELVTKLSQMEAARILNPLKSSLPFKAISRVTLKKADGAVIFELAWGQLEAEKATAGKPETTPEKKIYVARSSKSDHLIGVNESDLNGLPLKEVIKTKAAPAPTSTPSK